MSDAISDKELDEKLAELGEYAAAIDLEHQTKRLTMDEIYILNAKEMYEACTKHPITNEPAKLHASQIMGIMNQISDDTLVKLHRAHAHHAVAPLNTCRRVLARMVGILVDRRGLAGLV